MIVLERLPRTLCASGQLPSVPPSQSLSRVSNHIFFCMKFLLNFLLFFVVILMQDARLSKADAISALNDAMTANAKQFFTDSASSWNEHIKQTREQTLQILLNNANMTNIGPNVISDRLISEELNCSRKLVHAFRNNTTAFKDMKPPAKSTGLSKNHFIYKHNDLAQLIVKHWIEESTPSPNKKDVVNKHSHRPGDHSRVKPGEGKANYIKCNFKHRCKSDQRR